MANRKVLVPLDRSNYSAKILGTVERFIPVSDTELILFHVVNPPLSVGTEGPRVETDFLMQEQMLARSTSPVSYSTYEGQMEQDLHAEIKDDLHPLVRQLEQAGYKVSVVIEFGDPASEILRVIKDKKVDLVAMTTHAREGLKRLLFGSVAEAVLHQVDIPILLIHPA